MRGTRRLLGSLACAATAAALACAIGADDEAALPDPMLASLGSQTFQRYCASCHGADALGNGPAASALRTPPADLTRIAARRGGGFPDAEIATFIDGRFELAAHGTREMPIWGEQLESGYASGAARDEVVRGRILTLVEYLKSIQQPE